MKQIIIDYEEYLDLSKLSEIIRQVYFKGITEETKKTIEQLNKKYGWWI